MKYPCCKKELPAPLDGVALVTCPCGQTYLPDVIIDWNEIIDIIKGWRGVTNGRVYMECETKEDVEFLRGLMRRGARFLE